MIVFGAIFTYPVRSSIIRLMNQYRHEYYNLNAPTVSDEVYDRLFDELVGLQTKTCIYMANSPTMAPGYPPVSKLEKVNHQISDSDNNRMGNRCIPCAHGWYVEIVIILEEAGLMV